MFHNGENKRNNKNGNFFRVNVTSVVMMSTEVQNIGEIEIKMTTETKIILQEISYSMGNITTVEKEATGMLIVGQIKKNRKTMTLPNSLWEPDYVETLKKKRMMNMLKNG